MTAPQVPIAAIATAPGRGGIGVVRVSGPDVGPVMRAVCGQALKPRHATYLPFLDGHGKVIDHGLALYFPAPNSYTGEEVLELQGHGGPVVMQMLLTRCLQAGDGNAGADRRDLAVGDFLGEEHGPGHDRLPLWTCGYRVAGHVAGE